MNWSAMFQSLTAPKSLANAVGAFLVCDGAANLLHLPHAWLLGVVAVIANQVGLHQSQPGA